MELLVDGDKERRRGDGAGKSLSTQGAEWGFCAVGFHFCGKWDQKQPPLRAPLLPDNGSAYKNASLQTSFPFPDQDQIMSLRDDA